MSVEKWKALETVIGLNITYDEGFELEKSWNAFYTDPYQWRNVSDLVRDYILSRREG